MNLFYKGKEEDKISSGEKQEIERQDEKNAKPVATTTTTTTSSFDPFSNLFAWNKKKQNTNDKVIISPVKVPIRSSPNISFQSQTSEGLNLSVEMRLHQNEDGTRIIDIGGESTHTATSLSSEQRGIVDPFGNVIDPFGDLMSMLNNSTTEAKGNMDSNVIISEAHTTAPADITTDIPELFDVLNNMNNLNTSINDEDEEDFGEFQDAVILNNDFDLHHHDENTVKTTDDSDDFGEFQVPTDTDISKINYLSSDLFGDFQTAEMINDQVVKEEEKDDTTAEQDTTEPFHLELSKETNVTAQVKNGFLSQEEESPVNDDSNTEFIDTIPQQEGPDAIVLRDVQSYQDNDLHSPSDPIGSNQSILTTHGQGNMCIEKRKRDEIDTTKSEQTNGLSHVEGENQVFPQGRQRDIVLEDAGANLNESSLESITGDNMNKDLENNRNRTSSNEYFDESLNLSDHEQSMLGLDQQSGCNTEAEQEPNILRNNVQINESFSEKSIDMEGFEIQIQKEPWEKPHANISNKIESSSFDMQDNCDGQANNTKINTNDEHTKEKQDRPINPFAGGGIAAAAAAAAAKRNAAMESAAATDTDTATPVATVADTATLVATIEEHASANFCTVNGLYYPIQKSHHDGINFFCDPVLIAAMKGAQLRKESELSPLIIDDRIPRELNNLYHNFSESCNTSLSSASGKFPRPTCSSGISTSSLKTNETTARKSLVPFSNPKFELQNNEFSPDTLFSPSQTDLKVYSKSNFKAEKDFGIDITMISPNSTKWSPHRTIRSKTNVEYFDDSVSSNEHIEHSISSADDHVDFNNASQNSRMLLDCSSFTQHDFTPHNSGSLDLNKEQLKILLLFGTVSWQQIISQWKHSELAHMMIAFPPSHHFTKSQRSPSSQITNHFGSADSDNLDDFLREALEWEKSLSPETSNSNGICPSKLMNDASLTKISSFLTSMGALPFCCKTHHIWVSSLDKEANLRNDINVETSTSLLTDLVSEAEKNLSSFTDFVSEITLFSSKNSTSKAASKYSVGIKTTRAIVSKANRKYGGDIRQVKDILRAKIVLQDEAAIVCALVYIHRMESANFFSILRIKNHFRTSSLGQLVPTDLPTGYRHVLVNVRMNTGLIAEIQLNLKQFYDILGIKGYILHRNLVHLNQIKCAKDPNELPVAMCESFLCSCVENNHEDDSENSIIALITSFSSSQKYFVQASNKFCKFEDYESPLKSDENDNDIANTEMNAPKEVEMECIEKDSEKDSIIDPNSLQSGDIIYEWEHLNEAVHDLTSLDMFDLLVQAACDDIDQNPNDTALYLCLHEVYAQRHKLSGSKHDMENAIKSLETSLEIIDHANSIGMTGWLGYGKSTVLDRALERPYFTLSNLASFYASKQDWNASVAILKSLMLRCEQHLPRYHPISIVTILDVAAGLTELGKKTIAQNYIRQARSRLAMYLYEQEDACRRLQSIHSSRKEEPYHYFKLVGLDHYSMLRSFTQSMRLSLNRKMLKHIPNDSCAKALNYCFVSDSLMVLGRCLKNSRLDPGSDKEIGMLFRLAGEEYRRSLNLLVPSKGSSHPNSISISCGLAYCLSELNKPDEGLNILSAVISSSLNTLNSTQKQYHLQSSIDTPVNIRENYDDNFKIVTSIMGLSLRESIASALRLIAYLHMKEKPNGEGRAAAIGQMRMALELMTKSDSSENMKSSKSIRRTIKKELKALLEDTRCSTTREQSVTRPDGASPTASTAV